MTDVPTVDVIAKSNITLTTKQFEKENKGFKRNLNYTFRVT